MEGIDWTNNEQVVRAACGNGRANEEFNRLMHDIGTAAEKIWQYMRSAKEVQAFERSHKPYSRGEQTAEERVLSVECPECNAREGDPCYEPDPNRCASCGYVGCRTIDRDVPHKARFDEAAVSKLPVEPQPEPQSCEIAHARGRTRVTVGDVFTWPDGSKWSVVEFLGKGSYSPSGIGGTIDVACRLLSPYEELGPQFKPYTKDGICEFCGDSVAGSIAFPPPQPASPVAVEGPATAIPSWAIPADVLPCPFCGKTAYLHGDLNGGHAVSCNGHICGAFISGSPIHPALPKWNGRAALESTKPLDGQPKVQPSEDMNLAAAHYRDGWNAAHLDGAGQQGEHDWHHAFAVVMSFIGVHMPPSMSAKEAYKSVIARLGPMLQPPVAEDGLLLEYAIAATQNFNRHFLGKELTHEEARNSVHTEELAEEVFPKLRAALRKQPPVKDGEQKFSDPSVRYGLKTGATPAGFICANWKQVGGGVYRCDREEGHEGDHVDSVLLTNWENDLPRPGGER